MFEADYFSALGRKLRRAVLVGALVAAPLALAGCVDQHQSVKFNGDGTVTVNTAAHFDPEWKTLFDAVKVHAKYDPKLFLVANGVCTGIGQMQGMMTGIQQIAKEYEKDGKYVCDFTAPFSNKEKLSAPVLGSMPLPPELANNPLMDLVKKAPATQFKAVDAGDRTVRVALDFSSLPDMKKMVIGIFDMVEQQSGLPLFPPAAKSELAAKDADAYLALLRVFFRDSKMIYTISGAEIVDSNGKISPDGSSVSFEFNMADLMEIMFDATKRGSSNLYAVVKY